MESITVFPLYVNYKRGPALWKATKSEPFPKPYFPHVMIETVLMQSGAYAGEMCYPTSHIKKPVRETRTGFSTYKKIPAIVAESIDPRVAPIRSFRPKPDTRPPFSASIP